MKKLIILLSLLPPALQAQTLLTVGDSLTAGVLRGANTYKCLAVSDNETLRNSSCQGRGAINRGGWQPTFVRLTGLTTINYGVSGDRSDELLAKLPGLLRIRYEYVSVMIGTNDIIAEMPESETISNINKIIELIQASGSKPVLMTIPPIQGSRLFLDPKVVELNQKIRKLKVNVVDVGKELRKDWGLYNSGDWVHLSHEGNALIGEKLAKEYQKNFVDIPKFQAAINLLLLSD